jgi:hypothetical protein
MPVKAMGGGFTVRPNPSVTPRYEAVRLTAVGVVTVRGVTVNVPEVTPCVTTTVAGMVTSGSEALIPMEAPPLGAAADRPSVQVAAAGGVMDTGTQENPFSAAGWTMVTLPPLAAVVSAKPSVDAAMGLETCTCEVVSVVVLEMARDTVAATPLVIGVVLSPQSTHVVEPAPGLHESILLDAMATGPAITVAEVKSTPG